MTILLSDVSIERRLLQEGMLVMTVKEGRGDLTAQVGKDGFHVMGEVYPDLYVDGNALRFQREAALDVQEESVIIMPSEQIADLACRLFREEQEIC